MTKIGLCYVILVGDRDKIRTIAESEGIDVSHFEVCDEKDLKKVGLRAVKIVSSGDADVLVKGHMNTSDFLHAVLNREVGLRTGRILNVMTGYEVPKQEKIFFLSDGGMCIAPTLEDKKAILENCIPILHKMQIKNPKVAILAANERVNSKMPATLDAAALCEMAERGELPQGIYEGPIAFDVAMRPKAAEEKGVDSRVTGNVDFFLVPNIETGNCMGKAIGYFGHGRTAGIVVGAAAPVVMSSRSASVEEKISSIAWAILACG